MRNNKNDRYFDSIKQMDVALAMHLNERENSKFIIESADMYNSNTMKDHMNIQKRLIHNI